MRKLNKKLALCMVLCISFVIGHIVYQVNANDESVSKDYVLSKVEMDRRVDSFEAILQANIEQMKLFKKDNASGFITYVDEQENMYDIDHNGKVVGYLNMDYQSEFQSIIDEGQAEEIAKKCMLKVNVENKYQLISTDYNESLAYYRVIFNYIIDEYNTSEGMYFDIGTDGTVISYATVNLDAFKGFDIVVQEKSVIKERALKALTKENIGFTDFLVRDIIIDIEDGAAFYCVGAFATQLRSGEVVQISTKLPIN